MCGGNLILHLHYGNAIYLFMPNAYLVWWVPPYVVCCHEITPPCPRRVSLFIPAQISVHDGEVSALAILTLRSGLIHLASLVTQLEARARLLRSLQGEHEILLHEADAEATAVVPTGWGALDNALDGVVDLAGPALARADVDQVAQDLGIQTPLDTEVHGLCGSDVVDGQQVVVRELAREAGSLGTAVHDLLAHHQHDGLDAGDEGLGSAEHEGQGSGLGADDTARHGGVDELPLLGAVDGVGDLPRGRWVDGGAVNKESVWVGDDLG